MAGDDEDGDQIDMRPLLRLGAWGLCAVLALGSAVFAGRTEVGERRAAAAIVALSNAPAELLSRAPLLLVAKSSEPDPETRRLADTVRTLTADRERLAGRLAALERNLNDLTGSISRAPAPSREPSASSPAPAAPVARAEDKPEPPAVVPPPAQPAPAAASEIRLAPPPAETPGVGAPANVPLPRPAPLTMIQSYVGSYVNATPSAPAPPSAPETRIANAPASASAQPAARSAFAVDLAIASNPATLRARWDALRARHPALLGSLEPLMSVRDSARPGATELHLVVGPLPDAAAVSRLCAQLLGAGVRCQPTVFDGQELAAR